MSMSLTREEVRARNAAIVNLRRKGASLEEIAAIAQLSPYAIGSIIRTATPELGGNGNGSFKRALTEKQQRIIKLRKRRLTYAAIGEEVDLSGERVRQILKRHAPELCDRKFATRKAPEPKLDRDEIVRLRRRGMTYREIAKAVRTTSGYVGRIVREVAPELCGRLPSLDHASRNAKIVVLRRRGLTYREIGERLDMKPGTVAVVLHRLRKQERREKPS